MTVRDNASQSLLDARKGFSPDIIKTVYDRICANISPVSFPMFKEPWPSQFKSNLIAWENVCCKDVSIEGIGVSFQVILMSHCCEETH